MPDADGEPAVVDVIQGDVGDGEDDDVGEQVEGVGELELAAPEVDRALGQPPDDERRGDEGDDSEELIGDGDYLEL